VNDSIPGPEDRRKHLDFLQAVVTRMSVASAMAKSWLLPVVTATYGYALTKSAASIALLGMSAVVLFGFLDANYLRQEKAYRHLYDAVARGTRPVPLFSLDPSEADDPVDRSGSALRRFGSLIHRWLPGRTVWASWSIAPFYGALIFVGLAIFLRVR
jgi:hypothetical protein